MVPFHRAQGGDDVPRELHRIGGAGVGGPRNPSQWHNRWRPRNSGAQIALIKAFCWQAKSLADSRVRRYEKHNNPAGSVTPCVSPLLARPSVKA